MTPAASTRVCEEDQIKSLRPRIADHMHGRWQQRQSVIGVSGLATGCNASEGLLILLHLPCPSCCANAVGFGGAERSTWIGSALHNSFAFGKRRDLHMGSPRLVAMPMGILMVSAAERNGELIAQVAAEEWHRTEFGQSRR
jgi:hypothetical protein